MKERYVGIHYNSDFIEYNQATTPEECKTCIQQEIKRFLLKGRKKDGGEPSGRRFPRLGIGLLGTGRKGKVGAQDSMRVNAWQTESPTTTQGESSKKEQRTQHSVISVKASGGRYDPHRQQQQRGGHYDTAWNGGRVLLPKMWGVEEEGEERDKEPMVSNKDEDTFMRRVDSCIQVSVSSNLGHNDYVTFCRTTRSYLVNGEDLSHASHEDAVAAFRTAEEPIVVEVLRRSTGGAGGQQSKSSSSSSSSSGASGSRMKTSPLHHPPPSTGSMNSSAMSRVKSPSMVTVSTQTDDPPDGEEEEDEDGISGIGEPHYISEEAAAYYSYLRSPSPPALYSFNGNDSLVQPSSRHGVAFSPTVDLGLTDIEMANGWEIDENFDDERAFADIEYDEVTLSRGTNNEKVGLTLCYGSADDEITDIFVQEIEEYSIAAQNGHIREGDQILQINGVDVQTRDQAIRLFSENSSQITLLLARHIVQMDDGYIEDGRSGLTELQMMEERQRQDVEYTANLLAQGNNGHANGDEEGGTTDTATTENSNKHEKDSGVGRTDDSTKDNESSEQELDNKFGELHCSNDSFTSSNDPDPVSVEDVNKFREVLETRLPRKDSQSSIEREIAALNQEMEQIQLECQEIVDMHVKEQSRIKTSAVPSEPGNVRSPRLVPRMGTRLDYIRQLHAMQHDSSGTKDHNKQDTSTTSAYNTGDSCRSTPLTLELQQAGGGGGGSLSKNNNSVLCLSRPLPPLPPVEESPAHSGSVSRMSQTGETLAAAAAAAAAVAAQKGGAGADNNLQDLYAQYADVMYTNRENLQHTIMVQQKLFQQQLIQKQQSPSQSPSHHTKSPSSSPAAAAASAQQHNTTSSPLSSVHSLPPPSNHHHHQHHHHHHQQQQQQGNGVLPPPPQTPPSPAPPATAAETSPVHLVGDVQMEYVVKRRADGTRYIARRPIRNKLLKERARKINEERCGVTTDDDAMSEMKCGRYWNKADRKRQFEKARQRKEKSRAKMDTVKEHQEQEHSGGGSGGSGGGGGGGGTKNTEPNIVELSHRKMMRHKGKKVFDDFTTIQEMMVHGGRDSSTGKAYNPLLSVTTV